MTSVFPFSDSLLCQYPRKVATFEWTEEIGDLLHPEGFLTKAPTIDAGLLALAVVDTRSPLPLQSLPSVATSRRP